LNLEHDGGGRNLVKQLMAFLVGSSLIVAATPARAVDYKWDGRYPTRCQPVAWRQPVDWPEPEPYTVNRLFTQYGDSRVVVLSRRTRFQMGAPERRISGETNLSFQWHAELRAKASRINEWGLVKRYVGPYRSEHRILRGVWIEWRCKGKRLAGGRSSPDQQATVRRGLTRDER
jgi:hypothetical protein